jgi:hypothetical protein
VCRSVSLSLCLSARPSRSFSLSLVRSHCVGKSPPVLLIKSATSNEDLQVDSSRPRPSRAQRGKPVGHMASSSSAAQKRFLTQKQEQMSQAVQEVCTAFAGKPGDVLVSVTMAAKCMDNFKEIFVISSEAANVRCQYACTQR